MIPFCLSNTTYESQDTVQLLSAYFSSVKEDRIWTVGMAEAKKKEPTNIVHQNAIFVELVNKERKDQKVFKDYSTNPYKEGEVLIRPMCCAHYFKRYSSRYSDFRTGATCLRNGP